jgi:ABC-type branched-subunit amino acid transport system permease subunit
MNKMRRLSLVILLLALLIAAPYLGLPVHLQSLLYVIFFWITLATSWNMLSGYSGYFSFGHGAFFGVGMYGMATLATKAALVESWPALNCSLGVLSKKLKLLSLPATTSFCRPAMLACKLALVSCTTTAWVKRLASESAMACSAVKGPAGADAMLRTADKLEMEGTVKDTCAVSKKIQLLTSTARGITLELFDHLRQLRL